MKRLRTRVFPYARPVLWLALMVYVSAMAMPIFGELEGKVWPVVSDFQIRSTSRGAEGVTLQGTMRKQRDCVYLGMTIYAGTFGNPGLPRERLQVTFLDQPEDLSVTRLAGMQFWGPWVIRLPKRVSGPDFWIETRHRCHVLWETQTLNLRVTASSVFGEITASADGPPADTPR
jgi:hypothetical protein